MNELNVHSSVVLWGEIPRTLACCTPGTRSLTRDGRNVYTPPCPVVNFSHYVKAGRQTGQKERDRNLCLAHGDQMKGEGWREWDEWVKGWDDERFTELWLCPVRTPTDQGAHRQCLCDLKATAHTAQMLSHNHLCSLNGGLWRGAVQLAWRPVPIMGNA